MPLDPDASRILQSWQRGNGPAIESLPPAGARVAAEALADLSPPDTDQVVSVTEQSVGGVPCVVVTPFGTGPWPALVWLHGGGWVLGTAQDTLHTALDLAAAGRLRRAWAGERSEPDRPVLPTA